MFWDRVAFVYDIFADVINAKTHRSLCRIAAGMCAGGAVCAAFAGLLLKGYKRTDAD